MFLRCLSQFWRVSYSIFFKSHSSYCSEVSIQHVLLIRLYNGLVNWSVLPSNQLMSYIFSAIRTRKPRLGEQTSVSRGTHPSHLVCFPTIMFVYMMICYSFCLFCIFSSPSSNAFLFFIFHCSYLSLHNTQFTNLFPQQVTAVFH